MQVNVVRILTLGIAVCVAGWLPAAEPTAADLEFFEKEVRPLLVEHCYKCHSVKEKQRGGLLLDSREGLLTGGDNGPAIEPGQPAQSRLVDAIRYDDVDLKMPPKGKLADSEIATLTKWVELGAPWPKEQPTTGGKSAIAEFDLQERLKFWSFQPIQHPAPPVVKNTVWARDPIDQFILAKLEEAGLPPAQPAEKAVWLRRVTFDLIGLPPSPSDIENYLADNSPTAEEKVLDRLLDSVHYGERWARHWLDLVRYAETYGHEFDFEIPYAYEYRDYVIRAFNSDLPYNQFVIEHIAGDLLPEPRRNPTERFNESVIGTGFWWLGEGKHSPVDIRGEEAARVDNQLDVFGKTFLGLTIGCARCHDHKFDPIPTKDYYALAGYLQSSRKDVAFLDDPLPWEQRLKSLRGVLSQRRQVVGDELQRQRTGPLEHWRAVLLASRELAGPDDPQLVTVADKLQVSADVVRRFLTELGQAPPLSPLGIWQQLRRVPEAQFSAAVDDLRQKVQLAAANKELPDQGYDLAPFSTDNFGGWFVSGMAFGDSPVTTSQAVEAAVLQRPGHALMTPGAAHSGILSDRLRGVLRSPTFDIDRPRIWVRVAGRSARIRLVIDEFHLIQNPIYGGLAFDPAKHDQYTWQAIDVGMWQGHRGYLEFIDDGDGFVAVDRVVCSAGGPPVDPVSPTVAAWAARTGSNLPADVLNDFEHWLKAGLAVLPGNSLPADPIAAEAAVWLAKTSTWGPPEKMLSDASPETQQQARELSEQQQQFEAALPVPRRAQAMTDGTPENEHVFIRGNHKTLGDEVPRRCLEGLHGKPPEGRGSGRLELAEQLVSPDNPLLARVIVNRIWQHHFGEGLVRSPDDFGAMGQAPTHPELLDYLATEFVRDGWSIKRLHRRMLLSATYRQASHASAEAEASDPLNKLWHRMPILRLEGEIIRDAMLAVSGRLNESSFGPGVPPYLTPYMQGRGRPGNSGPLDGDGRRSVYLNVRRNFLTPMFLAFDYPTPFNTIGRRSVSNVPAQALCLMNNQLVLQQAQVWSQHVLSVPDLSDTERIKQMYLSAFARFPDPAELQVALGFIEEQAQLYSADERSRAWADLAHVLFNYKEFIFLK